MCRPQLREEHTAAWQVERLGFARHDVRHLVCTHLDVDHAGGLPDFPHADVHVHRREHDAVIARATLNERQRYRRVHFAHGPRWALHDEGAGDRWLGFERVRAIGDDVALIPLPGHTRGHCAVAVRAPHGYGVEWLLHCGDAYFFHAEVLDPPSCPAGLVVFQRTMAVDDHVRAANADRLRALNREHGGKVRLFSAHSPRELDELRALASGPRGDRARVEA
jgi:glyoxylase-like metal-dependent hydrolase (beta-lactamase superfamily II)